MVRILSNATQAAILRVSLHKPYIKINIITVSMDLIHKDKGQYEGKR